MNLLINDLTTFTCHNGEYPSFCGGIVLSGFQSHNKRDYSPESPWGNFTKCTSIKDGISKIFLNQRSIFISDVVGGRMQPLFNDVKDGEVVLCENSTRKLTYFKSKPYRNGNSMNMVQTIVIIVEVG